MENTIYNGRCRSSIAVNRSKLQGYGILLFKKLISYEVLVGDGSRWILDTTHSAKTSAMSRAQALLASNHHDAVRVTRLENDANEEVIYQKECAHKADKPVSISPVNEAAVCNSIDDVSGFEARKTTGRLLRQYLDEWGITALELLHDHGNIRQLMRTETLYDHALHRIASIQARALNEDPKNRNDTLYGLASQVADRAREARDTSRYVSVIKDKGLTAALAAIDKAIAPNERLFFTGAVLAGYLGQERDWKKKLALAVTLLEQETGEEGIALLDQICAEIIDGSEAVKALIGPQPNLVSALRIMARLSAGRYNAGEKSDTLPSRFNTVMASRRMPFSRDILLEKVARAISGTKPLTRENDETDRAAFLALFGDLIGLGGLAGGAVMSEAVTRRARLVLKSRDNDLSPAEGIASILMLLPNDAVKIGYLLDLSRSEFGGKYQGHVLNPLMDIVNTISSLSGLLPPDSSPEDILGAVKDLRRRIDASALGKEIGALIAKSEDRFVKELEPTAMETVAAPAENPSAPEEPAKADLRHRVLQTGDIIFNEGDPGDEAFMIVSGEVEISIKSDEKVVVLASVGRGQIIGEMALIDDQPRMASATATTETTLSVIPQEVFKKRLAWLAEEDRMISHLLEIYVNRLRQQARNL